MIRITGHVQPPQDPKLKVPPIGSHGAVAAVARLSAGETSTLKDEIAGLRSQVAALTSRMGEIETAMREIIASRATSQPAISSESHKSSLTASQAREVRDLVVGGPPWVAAGMSRASWYRRQAEAKGSQ